MTTSEHQDTTSATTDVDPSTGPIPVPAQRSSADPGHPSLPVGAGKRRPLLPWVLGSVIALLLVVVIGLAAALAATGGTQPASAPAPVPVPPSAAPSTASTPTAAAPVAPPTPPPPARAISAREWQQIAKNPDAHIGQSVIVYGHVTQFDAATGTQGFRASVDGVSHRQWYDYKTNTVLSGDQNTLKELVQGDLFRAEVVVSGSYSYTTTMGGSTTVPMLAITSVRTTGSAGWGRGTARHRNRPTVPDWFPILRTNVTLGSVYAYLDDGPYAREALRLCPGRDGRPPRGIELADPGGAAQPYELRGPHQNAEWWIYRLVRSDDERT